MDIGVKRLVMLAVLIIVVILSTGCATMMKNFRPNGAYEVSYGNEGSGYFSSAGDMLIKKEKFSHRQS